MAGVSAAYLAVFEPFAEEVRRVDPEARVPACPQWTTHDLLAHQVHQLAGWIGGTFPANDAIEALIAREPGDRRAAGRRQQDWIDQGVAARRSLSIDRLLDDWSQLIDDGTEGALDALLPDAAVHLFDLFGVGGRRSHRDHRFLRPAADFWVGMAETRLQLAGVDGVRFELEDGTALGAGTDPDPDPAGVVVRGSAFEILRTVASRRTRPQARARLRLPDAGPAVDHLALYGWRDTPLGE
jgi:Mycothiol maleylpyruvate isomerase N-terminal domain